MAKEKNLFIIGKKFKLKKRSMNSFSLAWPFARHFTKSADQSLCVIRLIY